MAYYNGYSDRYPTDRHYDEPDDIDGPPPPGFRRPPSDSAQWAPPIFREAPNYYPSPPRDFRGYPPPERRYEDYAPEYGSGQPHSSYPRDDYVGGPSYGHQPPEYGRGPPQMYPPPTYPPPDYNQRPRPHEFEQPPQEFERRPPPIEREPPELSRGEPQYDASAGRPPPPYEPEQRYPPESPKRGPPPPAVYPPPEKDRGIGDRGLGEDPPERAPVNASAGFPPMPYEPGAPPPSGPPDVYPPPAHETRDIHHERPVDASAGYPPMPYEPGVRTPERPPGPAHYDPNAGYPPQGPPQGFPPPFPEAHYAGQGLAPGGHVRRRHFEGCKDYWAAFLFFMHFWAVVGVCIYLGVEGVIKTNRNNDLIHAHSLAPAPAPPLPEHLYTIRNWAPQLAAAAGSGWIFAMTWQSLIRLFPKTMIYVCLSLGAVATGLLGIILISTGTAKGLVGLIFLVAALFQGLYVHLVRHRIPFAAIMLRKCLLVVHRFKGLYVISIWSVFVSMFWLAVWIFGVAGAVSFRYGGWYVALLIISLAWSMEVLRNVVNVTVASVVGTFYYEEHDMPIFPVMNAYRRAWTISFGSICLGSMFVAIVQTLHAIAKRLANEQGENEFLFSCVNCFLGMFEFFIKHFNKWAYVQVGMRGKSFIKSSKDTWLMFRRQQAELLINDDLTGAVLVTGCIIGGVLTALVGGCWTFATHRYLTVGVAIVSFFLGFFVTYLTMVVAESAVAAYYVCFAEDPATLQKHDPPTHQYMTDRKDVLDLELQE